MTQQEIKRWGQFARDVAAIAVVAGAILYAVFETKDAHSSDMQREAKARADAILQMEAAHGKESRRILCYLEEQTRPSAERNLIRCEQ